MKFSDIRKGRRATKNIEMPLVGDPTDGDRASITVALRVLTPGETAETVAFAITYAKSKGVANPTAGEPLYELGIRIKTVHLACIDPDDPDPDSEGARFFASTEAITGSPEIGRDGIYFLYEAQEAWQDTCSPSPIKVGIEDYWGLVTQLAADDVDPFILDKLRPATRLSCMRTIARQLLISLRDKSTSGSPSETPTTPESKPSRKPARRPPPPKKKPKKAARR